MAKLHPKTAIDKARQARSFLASFDGRIFGEFGEPCPHDMRHLAVALDHIDDLSAMVLALVEMVPDAPSAEDV